jgi:hypothetical protein
MARISLLEVVCSEIEGFSEVLMNTSRGIRGLSVYVICSVYSASRANQPSEWAQMTFRAPMHLASIPFNSIKEHDLGLDNANWYFYRNVNDQCPAWPSLLATTNKEKARLRYY